ncbi:MAG: GNAT family N-acetyltransferase [Gammaproteobacteria bacterium]|nr:GNAT family N-acetyltransferase [Gammaproteobacteria bacterium]
MEPPIDAASSAAAAALESDPFYRCITVEFAADGVRRRAALSAYLDYSIAQGRRVGRVVHLANAGHGVAIWLLPQTPEVKERERAHKRSFLRRLLGEAGSTHYHAMVDYMASRAQTVVEPEAWYLSIVAVAAQEQGRGLGRRLLAPTMAEADALGVPCYLETFSRRSRGFYERLGFVARAEFTEPTTAARYTLMIRPPPAVRS